jgi:hypothetical protein
LDVFDQKCHVTVIIDQRPGQRQDPTRIVASGAHSQDRGRLGGDSFNVGMVFSI